MSRSRKHDIVIGMPGLTAYSENISSLAETLKLFITDDILKEICHHTNAEGSSRIPKMWKYISSEELFAFLGFCMFSGICRTRKEAVAKPWTTNVTYARPIFHATKARDRFFQILRVIRFNDKTTRNQQRSRDKLAPIRNVFESIISTFQMVYTTNEHNY